MQFRVLVKRMPVLGRIGPEHRGIVLRRAGRGAALPAVACGMLVVFLAFLNLCGALVLFANTWGTGRAGVGWLVTVCYAVAWLVGGLVLAPMTAGWAYSAIALRRISRWLREGLCVACGYDLRATGIDEPCPECNAANLLHAGALDDEAFAASMLGGNGAGRSGE